MVRTLQLQGEGACRARQLKECISYALLDMPASWQGAHLCDCWFAGRFAATACMPHAGLGANGWIELGRWHIAVPGGVFL